MSIQQSVNQALQSGVYAAGIGKGLANQKTLLKQGEQSIETQKTLLKQGEQNIETQNTFQNTLLEMQKKAQAHLDEVRTARSKAQEDFNAYAADYYTAKAYQTIVDNLGSGNRLKKAGREAMKNFAIERGEYAKKGEEAYNKLHDAIVKEGGAAMYKQHLKNMEDK